MFVCIYKQTTSYIFKGLSHMLEGHADRPDVDLLNVACSLLNIYTIMAAQLIKMNPKSRYHDYQIAMAAI